MAIPNAFDLVGAISSLRDADSPAARQLVLSALEECGIPIGPAAATLLASAPRADDQWAIWFANPWALHHGRSVDDWAALRSENVVAVLRYGSTGRHLCQGKDPFYWMYDMPHDAKFGRGESDGVPNGIDPALVKIGCWVSDSEMAWVRWVSATMRVETE